jgi:hypothetical protein
LVSNLFFNNFDIIHPLLLPKLTYWYNEGTT